jgi:transcription antitermination factor NusG
MWIAARVRGVGTRAEHRAATDLRRHGIEAFWPEQRRFFICRRSREEKYRSCSLIPGYLFCRLKRDVDREIIAASYFMSYLLGGWHEGQFHPREIPASYVSTLIEHGPFEVNRLKSRAPFKRGQKVKLALGRIADIIGEVEGVDVSGKIMINAELFGGVRKIPVDQDRLEAAE